MHMLLASGAKLNSPYFEKREMSWNGRASYFREEPNERNNLVADNLNVVWIDLSGARSTFTEIWSSRHQI